jgi:DNA polymerase-3 subunit epsilon
MEPRNLYAAYKFYCDKDLENAHSAEADTIATYEILKAQLDRYSEKTYKDRYGKVSTPVVNDVKALSDFSFTSRNVDLIGHIALNDKNREVFTFGKHKGKVVEDVFRDEPSYYDWMMKSEFPLSTKKVITSIKLRGFNKESVKLDLK